MKELHRHHQLQNLLMAWHSEPSKLNESDLASKANSSDRALGQMRLKIVSLKANLQVLQALTNTCSAKDSGEEDKAAFQNMVTTITHDINSLFGLILALHHEASDVQVSTVSQDISVAFFGLDWSEVFATLEKLLGKVDQLQRLEEPASSSLLTLVMPYHLASDLVKLENDLKAHSDAVLKGRTNSKEKEHIRSEQRRMSLQPVYYSQGLKGHSKGHIGGKRRLSFDDSRNKGFFAGLMSLVRKRASRTTGSRANPVQEIEAMAFHRHQGLS